jgi:hypothetical protein
VPRRAASVVAAGPKRATATDARAITPRDRRRCPEAGVGAEGNAEPQLGSFLEAWSMVANYLRLIVFSAGLLIGIQVPSFVDQYAKRVSAHQSEVARNFAGFQDTANRYFGGSIEALIAHHIASKDQVFQDEARSIQELSARLTALTGELAAMRGPLIRQIIHVVFRPNREILGETWAEYTYTVPLNAPAIVSGIAIGTLLSILIEATFFGVMRLLRPRRARSTAPARAR